MTIRNLTRNLTTQQQPLQPLWSRPGLDPWLARLKSKQSKTKTTSCAHTPSDFSSRHNFVSTLFYAEGRQPVHLTSNHWCWTQAPDNGRHKGRQTRVGSETEGETEGRHKEGRITGSETDAQTKLNSNFYFKHRESIQASSWMTRPTPNSHVCGVGLARQPDIPLQ